MSVDDVITSTPASEIELHLSQADGESVNVMFTIL